MGRDLNVEVGPKPVKKASQDEPARLSLMPDEVTAYGFVIRILLWVAFCFSGLATFADVIDPNVARRGTNQTSGLCAIVALVGLAVSHQKR